MKNAQFKTKFNIPFFFCSVYKAIVMKYYVLRPRAGTF